MHVVDLSFVNRSDLLTCMKEGDKNYKSMLPCYYVEKIDEVKECAWQSYTLRTIQYISKN